MADSQFKYTELPPFLKREGESLLFSGDGLLCYYIPEEYFSNTSNNAPATIIGSIVEVIGVFDYALFNASGKAPRGLQRFNYPTLFRCEPSEIEKVKGLKLIDTIGPADYRILKFRDGDKAVCSVKTEQFIDNAEKAFRLFFLTGKFPPTVPYDEIHETIPENLNLNGNDYGVNKQFFGMLFSEICRDPNNVKVPFRFTKMESVNGYKPISVIASPKYSSPYISIASQEWDESVMAAVLSDNPKDTPLERVLTR